MSRSHRLLFPKPLLLATSVGVHKHEDASLSLLFGDKTTRFKQGRPNSGVLPKIGYALCLRSRGVQSSHLKLKGFV